ncbi:uncharacterized protein [Rutidosis leptorrhynchoides]|uniref:uncharacterized protein n=1 Tax=Rutidosis leptorrhynchoides TaxID=125765 RepID=UPI003A98DC59
MQRLCSKLRSLTAVRPPSSSSTFVKPLPPQIPSFDHRLRGRFFHSSPPKPLTKTLNQRQSFISPNFNPLLFNSPSTSQLFILFMNCIVNYSPSTSQVTRTTISNHASSPPISYMQVRHLTLKQRKRKLKSRQPLTPVVSKLKKYKMKSYSSFKGRFRTMNDGQIRRWKEGKRHNAHLKWFLLNKNQEHCEMISATVCLKPDYKEGDFVFLNRDYNSRFFTTFCYKSDYGRYRTHVRAQFLSPQLTYTVNEPSIQVLPVRQDFQQTKIYRPQIQIRRGDEIFNKAFCR